MSTTPVALIIGAGDATGGSATASLRGGAGFGAPTFFVDDQMFWGQDRLDFVKEALQ